MTQADIAPCLAMDAAWHQEALTREAAEGGLSTLDDEHRALVLALENREALGLDGIVLRWQEEILGFTLALCSRRTSSTCTSSGPEGTFKGPTRAVNRSFARYIREKYPPGPLPGPGGCMACPACARPRNPIIPITWKLILAQWRSAATWTSRPKTEG